MGDTHRWPGGGTASITDARTIADERRRYHSTREMSITTVNATSGGGGAAVSSYSSASLDAANARRYHSTRDIQVRPTSMHDLRCYSASYATYGLPPLELVPATTKGGGSSKGGPKAGYVPSSSLSSGGSFRWVDPELQRRKRVAGYKAYGVEGKVKGSVKKGWRWVRERYKDLLNGLR